MRTFIKVSGKVMSFLAICIASLSSGLLSGEEELPKILK